MRQEIALTNVGNARELGGYAAGERTVRKGLLLRTATLYGLRPQDRDTLERVYHVGAVADLRMSAERDRMPDPEIPGAENHFVPVMEMEDYPGYDPRLAELLFTPGADRLELMKSAFEMGMLSDRIYVDFLFTERGKAAYRGLFRCLVELPEGRACLWHCTDGKDRTGVAAMLVLTALGADRETIMEDYLLTNAYNAERIAAYRAGLDKMSLSPEMRELALFGAGAVHEKFMNNALQAMEERCGSPEGYLFRELGLDESTLEKLREKFLEVP